MAQNFSKERDDDEATTATNIAIDRISGLPEVIIHHILSFVQTKEAAKTMVLSKFWLQLWSTRPVLDFDQAYFGLVLYKKINDDARIRMEDPLLKVLNDTMEDYCSRGLPIQKLRLHMNTIAPSKYVPFIKNWFRRVLQNGVGELDFNMLWEGSILPPEFFEATSLQVLKVTSKSLRCKLFLGTNHDIKCRNLKKLELEGIAIDAATFHNVARCCPLIEELSLKHFGWSQVHVCNLPNLRVLRLECTGVDWVRVDAPMLQSLIIRCMGALLHIGVSGNLKVVSASDVAIADETMRKILSANPRLEELSLIGCTMLERINLSSPFLKHLHLSRCGRLVEAVVDAPNLRLLKWHNLPRSSLPITTPASNGESEVIVYCGTGPICWSWFEELREFLTKFRKSEVEITLSRDAKFESSEGFRAIPVPSGHELEKLTLCYEQSISVAHLDAFFSICHPKTVLCKYADTEFNNAIITSMCKEELGRNMKNPKCCKLDPIKCWRHCIKDAKFQFEVDDDKIRRYGWLAKKRVSFALEWNV